jgi:hypothetical protein
LLALFVGFTQIPVSSHDSQFDSHRLYYASNSELSLSSLSSFSSASRSISGNTFA